MAFSSSQETANLYLPFLLKSVKCFRHKFKLLWAEFVAFIEVYKVFAEALFTGLAREMHFQSLFELMVGDFIVTFSAIEPFFTARSSDGDLGVENMFAHCFLLSYLLLLVIYLFYIYIFNLFFEGG